VLSHVTEKQWKFWHSVVAGDEHRRVCACLVASVVMSAKLFPLGIINQTNRQSTGAVIFFHGSGNKFGALDTVISN
jgi:hypothetical protein